MPREPLTDEEIAELRDLLGKASDAPWVPYSQKDGKPAHARAGHRALFIAIEHEPGIDDTGKNCQADNDVLLTVVARNKLARLLDEVEAARRTETTDEVLDGFDRRLTSIEALLGEVLQKLSRM